MLHIDGENSFVVNFESSFNDSTSLIANTARSIENLTKFKMLPCEKFKKY